LRRTAAALSGGCAGLALLTWILVASDFSHPATGALLYLIVIVLLSITGNIAAGIGLAIIATFCLDYFFTEPRFTFQINATEDVVAVAAFALTAVAIAILAGRARRSGEAVALGDRLQVIIDTIPAMVWSISPDGSSDFLNKRFRDYTGLSLEDIRDWARTDALHRPWMNALHPDDRSIDDWSGRSRLESRSKRRRGCGSSTENIAGFCCALSRCATKGVGSSNGTQRAPTLRI